VRTSVTLDEDVYELASLYATGRGITLGKAIGELVRKGQAAERGEKPSSRLVREPNGLLVIASTGRRITPEIVKAALEEDE